jgi:hypothetical protein
VREVDPVRTTTGIEILRDERGEEQITFKDVADHFVDFVDRYPEHSEAIDRVAQFLAKVEDVEHDHDRDEGGGIKPGEKVDA